jgi:hypothetical protein
MEIRNNWITGFVDGDGCFNIQKILTKNKEVKIRHRFIVSQDKRSVDTLYALKKKLKCGSVHKAGKNMMAFTVSDKKSIENIIIPFFKKYPLQTEKRKDFYKFVESVTGQQSSTNNNFYNEQIKNFNFSIDDQWFAGFVDAEACFYVSIVKNYPRPQLLIGASEKEKDLFFFLKDYLQCGTIRIRKDKFVMFTVTRNEDFITKIFPKLYTKTSKNLLKTIKRHFFMKFRKIVLLILKKQHLNSSGMEKILKLKLTINKPDSLLSFVSNTTSLTNEVFEDIVSKNCVF